MLRLYSLSVLRERESMYIQCFNRRKQYIYQLWQWDYKNIKQSSELPKLAKWLKW